MLPSLGSLFLGLAAAANAASIRGDILNSSRISPRTGDITWTGCLDDSGKDVPGRECAHFEVPLDWHNASAGWALLAVARYPAVKQPKLGTLFMNPGGPSGSGVDTILSMGSKQLMEAAGGQYDIVSWDPRGVGRTTPRAECFKNRQEETAFWEGTIPNAGLEARGNFTDQRDLDEFYAQVDEVDVLLEELGQRCIEYSPNTFQYIGTTAVVRDMVAMHDILEGPDKPVNFWGFSYGTVVGIYFVNMFPDRVGRVVLDGVVDPVYWANRPAHELWSITPESVDEAFTGFAAACEAAGPSGCAIASANSTTDSIRQWTRDLLDTAYDYRREVGPSAQLTSAIIRNVLYGGMYQPTGWPELAEFLAGAYNFLVNASAASNSTVVERSLTAPLPIYPLGHRQAATNSTNSTSDRSPGVDYSFQGVTCADAVDAGDVTTKDVFDMLVNVTRSVSPMFGPLWSDAGLYCHRWPVRAVERYTGPWNKKLANTILVIGNEADPITPFISAKSVADALGDSAILIEQDDYGHLSLAMHSTCTLSALGDYFVNNKLPSEDKFCGTDQVLFPGPGVTKSTIGNPGSSNTLSTTTDNSALENELEKIKKRSHNLFIAVIALAAATGLLLVSLLFSCLRGRKNPPLTRATYIPRGAFEKSGDGEEQGHTYDNPYAPGSGSKEGGYSRVGS